MWYHVGECGINTVPVFFWERGLLLTAVNPAVRPEGLTDNCSLLLVEGATVTRDCQEQP